MHWPATISTRVNAGDLDRLAERMTENSVYQEPATGRRPRGQGGNPRRKPWLEGDVPDLKGTMTDAFACGGRGAQRIDR